MGSDSGLLAGRVIAQVRWLAALALVLAAVATAAPTASAGQPPPASLTPPPPSAYTCMGIGNTSAAICRRSSDFSFTPDPNFPDATCGSGTGAFDVLEAGTQHGDLTRRYNEAGLWTDLVAHNTVTGSLVNSVTGAAVPFTANYTYREVFVTPGDPAAGSTVTLDGLRYQVVLPGQGLVVHDVGMLRAAPDGTVIEGGPHPLLLGGDLSELCAALAA